MVFKDLGYTGVRITKTSQAEVLDGEVIGNPESTIIFDNLTLLENFSRVEESTPSETGVNRNQNMKVSILKADYKDFTFDLSTPLEDLEIEFNLSKKLQGVAFNDTLGDVVKCKVVDIYETGFDILKLVVFKIVTLE